MNSTRKDGDMWTETEECKECGAFFESKRVSFFGKPILAQKFCPGCVVILTRKVEHAKQIELEARWMALCPADFQNTNPCDTRLNVQSVEAVFQWTFNPKGLLLHGKTGLGKTRAIWHLLQRLYLMEGIRFKWMTAATFCEKSSDAAGKGESDEFTESLVSPQILFIDDIGKGKMTERNAGSLFNVLDQRFINQKPVFMTMNLIGEELAKRIDPDMGAPLVRRMREFCIPIKF